MSESVLFIVYVAAFRCVGKSTSFVTQHSSSKVFCQCNSFKNTFVINRQVEGLNLNQLANTDQVSSNDNVLQSYETNTIIIILHGDHNGNCAGGASKIINIETER